MKILVISPQPFFSSRGTPLSVYYRALVMAEQGVDIDLLTYGSGKDVKLPGVRVVRIPRLGLLEPLPIGPSWSKVLLDAFMVAWTVGMLLRYRYHVVHAHEEAVFWARLLKPIFGFRLVYDMHSSLPQQLQNFRFSRSRLLIGAFNALERGSVRAADAVITICPDLSSYAIGLGAVPGGVLVIENSLVDPVNIVDPLGSTATEPIHQTVDFGPGHPVILYAGTFEAYQGVDILIEAFAEVLKERPDARLLLVGGTSRQVAQARALAESLGVENRCALTGNVSRNIAASYTQCAQVLVSMRLTGGNTPLKIYELLASGKPMVATRVWAHTQVLDDSICFLPEPNSKSLAESLLQALNDEAEVARRVGNALDRFNREYARPVYQAKIRRLLEILA